MPALLNRRPWAPVSSAVQRPRACSKVAQTRVLRAAATSFATEVGVEPGSAVTGTTNEDFYGILGVDPNASVRDVRKAYLELMRDFHPDRHTGDSPDAAAANELCAVLNEIYETLSDADKRNTYDALVGFSADSVNPFEDTSQERDQVFVDELACIGCAMCVRTCPSTFALETSKYARARAVRQASTDEEMEEVQIAIETCPVDCITYVTLPQLSLLETALSTMKRIDVSVMRRSGRGPPSVFDGAMLAWRRRQAAIEDKARTANVNWQWWQAAGSMVDDPTKFGSSGSSKRGGAPPPENADSRSIAKLAAVAARAARLWRSAGGSRARAISGLLE